MIISQSDGKNFTAIHGDCVQAVQSLPDSSIGYSVFSPPFASLYTYSDSPLDMGNCRTHAEFYQHFSFLVKELHRVLMPGRLVSFHCMNLPTSKERDGFIGITDFRGELIRIFQSVGFVFHSEVTIWKDPVTAMQRTKALGLLHKTVVKDSSMSRQGIADYVVTMRKLGDNPEPIAGAFDNYIGTNPPSETYTRADDNRNPYSINVWQRYASPVWMDINPSRTLQYTTARDEADERHICPLQLDVIERCLQIWSNPNDVVLSPFMGIGSEGYSSLLMGRKFIGVELKQSYFDHAVKNLKEAEAASQQGLFFDEPAFVGA